ncbi:MAG: hypothetical protein ABFS35_21540 [Bacteroidota bacterium]
MKPVLVYNEPTNTIRQMPQNYLIARGTINGWTTDGVDMAADKDLATRVFLELFNFESKYGTGLELLAKVTPNSDFKNKE